MGVALKKLSVADQCRLIGGMQTIEKMHAAGAACLVLEPGKTIILERAKVMELADRYKIAIVGYNGNGTENATP